MERLLALHEKQVFRFGLRMCGDEDAAREVLQETLLSAFKNLRDFRGDARLSTWLYQIARSYCTKARRRGVGEPERHEELDKPEVAGLASEEPVPEERAHAGEIAAALHAAILSLPEAQREVVVLRDVEGLSAEEAARVVGIDVGALKSRLHRARLELRGHLAALIDGASGQAPCPDLAQELTAYAEADIDQSTCAAIEQHLRRCTKCTSACDHLSRTVSLCRAVPRGGEVPGPIQRAVRQALRQAMP